VIEISLTTALALYSGCILLGTVVIWLYTELRTQHAYHVLEKQYLWRCVFCAYTYLDEAAEALSQCPRCHSINSMQDAGARFVRASGVLLPEPDLPREVDQRRSPSRQKRPGAKRRGPRRRR
jgi:hypothetical protein